MISLDASVLVVFVVVWILVAVLKRVFFSPLRGVMTKRIQAISGNRRAGHKAVEEYEQTVRRIEEEIKAAKVKAQASRERLEREALQEKERLVAEVSQEMRAQVSRAKKDMADQLARLKKELDKETRALAQNIETRIMRE